MPKPTRPPPARTSRLLEDISQTGEEMDRRIALGDADRRRREELHGRFRDRLSEAARTRGDDPYQLLAEAIRRMLRE